MQIPPKDNITLIDDGVSRSESRKIALSSRAWSWGFASFFINQVPYSFSTSHRLAGHISDILALIPEDKHMIEVGAGSGLLSKRIFDKLKDKHPDHYAITNGCITEHSDTLINEWNASKRFADHPNCHTKHLSTSDKLPIDNSKANIIVMSNVLSTTPCNIINTHTQSEVLVRSYLQNNAEIIDTRQMPPQIHSADTVHKLIQENDTDTLGALIHQIAPLIQETPIISTNKGLFFNSRHSHIHKLLKTLKNAPKNSLLILIDFGFNEAVENIDHLMTSFGAISICPLFFNEINDIAHDLGLVIYQSPERSGDTHVMIISNTPHNSDVDTELVDILRHINPNLSEDIISALNACDTPSRLTKTLQSESKTLDDDALNDDFLIKNIAAEYLRVGDMDTAKQFAEKAILLFPESAAISHLFISHIDSQQGSTHQSIDHLKKAIRLCPNYAPSYYALAGQHMATHNWQSAESALETYFMHAPTPNSQALITMALIYAKNNKPNDAESLCEWIIQNKSSSYLKEEDIEKAKQILKLIY